MRLLDRLIKRDAGYWEGMASGAAILTSTYGAPNKEAILPQYAAQTMQAHASNGIVFGAISARVTLFSEATFRLQALDDKHLYGNQSLAVLEVPMGPNTTTGELLARMEQDVSLTGNAYIWDAGEQLVRLRPDWVTIISELTSGALGGHYRKVTGYWFEPPQPERAAWGQPQMFTADEVAHWSPIPDPVASFRGMSWLTPVMREVSADNGLTSYKIRYLENAAAQPYNARVLTPSGWTRMQDITVGDLVTGPDGKPRRVLGVFPQGEKQVYRLTFSGGATAECCEDHYWTVLTGNDFKRGTMRTLSLKEIRAAGLRYPSGSSRWAIPLPDPVEYDDAGPLPLDPYLLGMLLGDGSFRSNGKGSGGVTLAAHQADADETENLLRPLLPAGNTIKRRDRTARTGYRHTEFYFKGPGAPKENPLTRIVRDLGLFDVHGRDKAVPEIYMQASVTGRVALLQGLIDSDGHVNRAKHSSTGVRFGSTSEMLARQVCDLVRSLGGTAKCKQAGFRPNEPDRRPQWQVYFNKLPEWIIPARLARKRTAYRPSSRSGRWQYLVSAEPAASELVQCIKVDAEDGLYVTDDFIVTHNTPNIMIRYPQRMQPGTLDQIRDRMKARYGGVDNAFRTLVLDQGADLTVVGHSLEQMNFATVQAAGENRILVASRVPGIVVGSKEGLMAATYSNYQQAMRSFADLYARPQWRSVCACLQKFIPGLPAGARLWFDVNDVAALRQGEQEQAQTTLLKAQAAGLLTRYGYDPMSAVAAIESHDFGQLTHAGLPVDILTYVPKGQPPSIQLPFPDLGDTSPAPGAHPATVAASNGKPAITGPLARGERRG